MTKSELKNLMFLKMRPMCRGPHKFLQMAILDNKLKRFLNKKSQLSERNFSEVLSWHYRCLKMHYPINYTGWKGQKTVCLTHGFKARKSEP